MAQNIGALLVMLACIAPCLRAQSSSQLPDSPTPSSAPTIRNLPRNLLDDQIGVWSTPFRLSEGEGVAGLFFLASAGAIGSEDSNVMRHHFLDQNTANHANTASTGLLGLLVAAPVTWYGVGHLEHSQKMQQTGILDGEAMTNALSFNEVVKAVARRERPTLDNGRGRFFQPVGMDSSFASNHSVIAWSSATVLAGRSDHMLVKVAAYGLATGVSASRLIGRDHFPSDVYVGSAVGWMIGRYVLHHHAETVDR